MGNYLAGNTLYNGRGAIYGIDKLSVPVITPKEDRKFRLVLSTSGSLQLLEVNSIKMRSGQVVLNNAQIPLSPTAMNGILTMLKVFVLDFVSYFKSMAEDGFLTSQNVPL